MESPCKQKCKLGLDGKCVTCRRTKQEIGQWPYMNDTDRKKIMDKLKDR